MDCEEESRSLMVLQLQSYCTDSLDELDLIKQVTDVLSLPLHLYIVLYCTVPYIALWSPYRVLCDAEPDQTGQLA
jgi:hypothetical protein